MTREIAKRIVKGITDKIECNTADIDDWAEFWGFTREEYEEFLDMAIKVLEQEPSQPMVEIDLYSVIKQKYIEREVLDKIRAEIGNINLNEVAAKYEDRFYGFQREVIKIIDKYKAESENP